MFDRKRELLDRIRLGEDSFLELKEIRFAGGRISAPSRDGLADELAAFGNTLGGTCVLGVDDTTREVLGIPLEHLDRVEAFVREVCNDSAQPPLLPVIERMFLPNSLGIDVPVLRIEIAKSLFVHRSPNGYFHRAGSSKRETSPDYLARLFQQRSQTRIIRFDEQAVPTASLDLLNEKLWRRFDNKHPTSDSREVFLNKLGLARKDEGGAWRPTVAGVLMASEDARQFLPNAFIQAVSYRSTSATPEAAAAGYQLDAMDITGPLDRQVTDACRFVARNMWTAAKKTIGRTDIPQYDMTAIFEALVNAVAHRDYAIHGSKIRLRMYADRLELFSPGALANTMTVESLPLRQSARNEVVTSLLARCPVPHELSDLKTERTTMMDKRGEGVSIILERTQALAGRVPEYRLIDHEELLLAIPAANVAGHIVE
ncbi:MAG: putative DNA binding domain-containing protein [Candidatus Solibacter usitatus]|nr:putative DNA binding domain-containing protein [Candidatus Solibacter usitatus]